MPATGAGRGLGTSKKMHPSPDYPGAMFSVPGNESHSAALFTPQDRSAFSEMKRLHRMAKRPYVILSCAMSVDGYIDDTTPERLRLSDEADWDRVDQVRAESDAIMIGATTLRRDNPRLTVKSPERQAARAARGLPACPLKVTVTGSGDLSADLRFWHSDVAGLGTSMDFGVMLDDLAVRGAAPRFVNPGAFPDSPSRRLQLAETRIVGDIALLRYLPGGPLLSRRRCMYRRCMPGRARPTSPKWIPWVTASSAAASTADSLHSGYPKPGSSSARPTAWRAWGILSRGRATTWPGRRLRVARGHHRQSVLVRPRVRLSVSVKSE